MEVCYRSDAEIHYLKKKTKQLSPATENIWEWIRIKDLFKDAALRADVSKCVESLRELNQKYNERS